MDDSWWEGADDMVMVAIGMMDTKGDLDATTEMLNVGCNRILDDRIGGPIVVIMNIILIIHV